MLFLQRMHLRRVPRRSALHQVCVLLLGPQLRLGPRLQVLRMLPARAKTHSVLNIPVVSNMQNA